MAAVSVFVFPVDCAGTGARQSLPCPLSGRRQEAGESSLIPAQQQRLQLSRAHRELLRQNAYVHLINLSPTLFVSQFLSLVSFSLSAHHHTRSPGLLNTTLKMALVGSLARVAHATVWCFPYMANRTFWNFVMRSFLSGSFLCKDKTSQMFFLLVTHH